MNLYNLHKAKGLHHNTAIMKQNISCGMWSLNQLKQ